MLISQNIHNKPIFYLDKDNDPIVSEIKLGSLHGYNNWLLLNSFIIHKDYHIVDCGANLGTFSFIPALIENKKMILIDGAKENIECLKETFKNISNVDIHHKILLDTKKRCSFSHNYGPFGCANEDTNGDYLSSTLDEIILDKKISSIKIDVEGNEPEVLVGSKQTISKYKPVLLIEVNGHCLRLHQKTPKDIFDILDDLEYCYFLVYGKVLILIDKEKKFPFCIKDIIAIHKSLIFHYISRFIFRPCLSDIEISQLLSEKKQKYRHTSQDCYTYLNSI